MVGHLHSLELVDVPLPAAKLLTANLFPRLHTGEPANCEVLDNTVCGSVMYSWDPRLPLDNAACAEKTSPSSSITTTAIIAICVPLGSVVVVAVAVRLIRKRRSKQTDDKAYALLQRD